MIAYDTDGAKAILALISTTAPFAQVTADLERYLPVAVAESAAATYLSTDSIRSRGISPTKCAMMKMLLVCCLLRASLVRSLWTTRRPTFNALQSCHYDEASAKFMKHLLHCISCDLASGHF